MRSLLNMFKQKGEHGEEGLPHGMMGTQRTWGTAIDTWVERAVLGQGGGGFFHAEGQEGLQWFNQC